MRVRFSTGEGCFGKTSVPAATMTACAPGVHRTLLVSTGAHHGRQRWAAMRLPWAVPGGPAGARSGNGLVVTLEAHRRLPPVWFGATPARRLHR